MTRILVVDDMPALREPIAAALRAAGYEAVCATDGKNALKEMRERPPDMVLLDIAMPELDGLAVLRTMRSEHQLAGIPVILLTAYAERSYIAHAAKYGVRDYLLKSQFSLRDLAGRIQARLDERQRNDRGTGPARDGEAAPQTSTEPPERHEETGPGELDAPRAASGMPNSGDEESAAPRSNAAPPNRTAGGEDRGRASGSAPGRASASTSPSGSVVPMPAHEEVDPSTALRSLTPVIDEEELSEQLVSIEELQGFSPTVLRLLKLTGDPNCSIDSVMRTICQDHAVALKVLKLANSAAFTRGEPVESVRDAVLRIGLSRIRQVVLNIGVIERFNALPLSEHLNLGLFWEHAIGCGLVCAEIAHALELKDSDTSFTAGLLHDMGRLVFVENITDEYRQVLETAASLELPLEQVESRMLNTRHTDFMVNVLRAWKFSPVIAKPIVNHHFSAGNLRTMPPEEMTRAAALALANRICHALLLGASGNHTVYPTEELADLLKLDARSIARIETVGLEQTTDMKMIMLAKQNPGDWPQMSHEIRSMIPASFRPLYISAAPEYDAYRMLCEQLSERMDDEDPNIAIVHITKNAEKLRLTRKLVDDETGRGLAPLPLVVISPAGKFTLENSAMNTRPHRVLRSPVVISRFVRAVNELLSGSAAAAA